MKNLLLVLLLLPSLFSCTQPNLDSNSQQELFDEFWTWVDQNYIYFKEKDVDWDEVKNQYNALIDDSTTEDELFGLMGDALRTLKDAHNRLERVEGRTPTYNFKENYDIHFDVGIVKSNYVIDSLGANGNLYWAMLNDNVGYVHLSDFNRYGSFLSVFKEMKSKSVSKLVIDMRNNGGGDSNDVPALLGALVQERTTLGAYIEKSGPAHYDKTDPIFVYADPMSDFHFDIPIVVLINRACYSATSYFAAMIKELDHVTLMGQITGGGGGNLGYQLSNGWLVAVSVSDFVDKQGISIEPGVTPDVSIENSLEDLENGRDKMLEMAISF